MIFTGVVRLDAGGLGIYTTLLVRTASMIVHG